jgi:hypothetical protein
MGKDRAAFAYQTARTKAAEESARFERDHVCAEGGMSVAGLSARIRPSQDDLQSLQPLEWARNLAKNI